MDFPNPMTGILLYPIPSKSVISGRGRSDACIHSVYGRPRNVRYLFQSYSVPACIGFLFEAVSSAACVYVDAYICNHPHKATEDKKQTITI